MKVNVLSLLAGCVLFVSAYFVYTNNFSFKKLIYILIIGAVIIIALGLFKHFNKKH